MHEVLEMPTQLALPLLPPAQEVPFLGELQAVRVGSDGSGLFPGWHLRCGTGLPER